MSESLAEKSISTTVNWWRLPWALLWCLPALSVVAGLVTVSIAIRYGDSMVKDDYYRHGLAYNAQQQADQAAARYHMQAVIVIVNQQLLLTISAERLPSLPDSLQLQLSHPTDSKVDQTLTLIRQGPQTYGSALPATRDSNWYVQLQPDDARWRLRGRWHAPTPGQLKPEIL